MKNIVRIALAIVAIAVIGFLIVTRMGGEDDDLAASEGVIIDPPINEVQAEPIFEEMIVEEAVVLEDVDPEHAYDVVDLFFATNRALAPEPDFSKPAEMFLAVEGPEVLYGLTKVSIPPNHEVGHLETQGWLESIFSEPNPEKHVILQSMEPLDKDEVMRLLGEEMNFTTKSVLFYIHGFNTGLDTAARRAGQLTYDLDWSGPSFFFSWPSQDSFKDYPNDKEKARGSRNDLQEVFEEIAKTEADRIVVIAHSMGTDLLTQTLERMALNSPDALAKIKNVILAAPDINATNFRTDIVPVFQQMREADEAFNVTLYASAEDSALKVSEALQGDKRIGMLPSPDADERARLFPVQVVDATSAVTNFFGHTYINDNPTVIEDVYCMINNRPLPTQRATLEGVPNPEGPQFRISAKERTVTVDNDNQGSQFKCD